MSTLADELLNDFEASGSENGEDQGRDFLEDNGTISENRRLKTQNGEDDGGMVLDGDEEKPAEEELGSGKENEEVSAADDEEANRAKVEKMQLGNVDDVRSVAGLMKTLEPVLEVSSVYHST